MSDDDDKNLSYPLHWPTGWPRAKARTGALFRRGTSRLTIADAVARVLRELGRLGVRDPVISSNVRPTLAGVPASSNGAAPADPGVAVYFRLGKTGDQKVLACDKWDRLADNIAAVAAHVEALRGQERWGVGTLAQAFAGYKALPAVEARKPWWEILGVKPQASMNEIEVRRLFLLERHHPDRGGNANVAAEVNAAFDEAMAERGAGP
jgi:hypothetical protein